MENNQVTQNDANKKEKTKLLYFSLSYKQRYYRTLRLLPLYIFVVILFFWAANIKVALGFTALMILAVALDLRTNYKKWQEAEERERLEAEEAAKNEEETSVDEIDSAAAPEEPETEEAAELTEESESEE